MTQIDLDDLPARIARSLAALAEGDELVLVQHGVVVVRLCVKAPPIAAPGEEGADMPAEERMKDVLDQFNAMIHDEF